MRSFLILLILSCFLIITSGNIKKYLGSLETLTLSAKKAVYTSRQNLGKETYKDEEIEKLKRENEVFKNKINSLTAENESFRKLLQAPLPSSWEFIPASVIGFSRYLSIDKGEEDGVKIGNVVISENILVGKVISVTPKTAKVILPQDPQIKIPVRTENGSRGEVSGQFGTKIVLENVLQKESLEEGERIITSGEEYPAGLLLGKVTKVIFDEREPYKKAELTPLLDYDKLTTVFVKKD